MYDIRQSANRRRFEIGFDGQGHLGGPTDDQVSLDRQRPQQFEQPHPVNDAGGATDPDDQTPRSAHFFHITICKIG